MLVRNATGGQNKLVEVEKMANSFDSLRRSISIFNLFGSSEPSIKLANAASEENITQLLLDDEVVPEENKKSNTSKRKQNTSSLTSKAAVADRIDLGDDLNDMDCLSEEEIYWRQHRASSIFEPSTSAIDTTDTIDTTTTHTNVTNDQSNPLVDWLRSIVPAPIVRSLSRSSNSSQLNSPQNTNMIQMKTIKTSNGDLTQNKIEPSDHHEMYVVRDNEETLRSIAARFNTTPAQIKVS